MLGNHSKTTSSTEQLQHHLSQLPLDLVPQKHTTPPAVCHSGGVFCVLVCVITCKQSSSLHSLRQQDCVFFSSKSPTYILVQFFFKFIPLSPPLPSGNDHPALMTFPHRAQVSVPEGSVRRSSKWPHSSVLTLFPEPREFYQLILYLPGGGLDTFCNQITKTTSQLVFKECLRMIQYYGGDNIK